MTASLIDTNILVYANNKDSIFHSVCKSLLEKAVTNEIETVISIQNLIELYAVISDKRRVEHPLLPNKAKELIEFYKSNIRVITPSHKTIDKIIELIDKHSPNAQSIFDYFLVATMLDNDVYTIFTANDNHFRHFESIEIINPVES